VDLAKSTLNFAATGFVPNLKIGQAKREDYNEGQAVFGDCGRNCRTLRDCIPVGTRVALAFYGDATPNAPSILSLRFYGASLLSVGLVVWFVRETSDWTALRGLLLGLSIGNVVGVAVSIWGTVTGIMNAMGWSVVLIYLVLLAGFVYYLSAGRADARI